MKRKTEEKKVEEKLDIWVKGLKLKGVDLYQQKPFTGGMGQSGHPDRNLYLSSKQSGHPILFGVEAKGKLILPSGELTKNKSKLPTIKQVIRLREIKAVGGEGWIAHADNVDDVILVLTEFIETGVIKGNMKTMIEQSLDVENYAREMQSVSV